jgi:hypothetical protein
MNLAAADGTLQTPDGITPLVGYRVWDLAAAPGHRMLVSMNGDVAIDAALEGPWRDRHPSWLTARCLSGPRGLHAVPDERCTCGVYSVKSLFTLGAMFAFPFGLWREPEGNGAIIVGGRVEIAGKVIQHDLGFRSERMRIAELLPFEGSEQLVGRFARRAGMHVGDSIPTEPAASATPLPSSVQHHLAMILHKLGSGSGTPMRVWATPASSGSVRSSGRRTPSRTGRPPYDRRPGEDDPGAPAA